MGELWLEFRTVCLLNTPLHSLRSIMLVLSVFMDWPWQTKPGVLTAILKTGTSLPAPPIKLPQPSPTLPPPTVTTACVLIPAEWPMMLLQNKNTVSFVASVRSWVGASSEPQSVPDLYETDFFFSLRQALPFLPPAKLQLLPYHPSEWTPTKGQRRNCTTVPLVLVKRRENEDNFPISVYG